MTRHCLTCYAETKHCHIHDTAHAIPETHMSGTERFLCRAYGRSTFAHSECAETFPFVLDTVRLVAGKAG